VDDNGIVTFEVRVSVEDPDKLLRPDMTADARLVVADRGVVPTGPHTALRQAEDGSWYALRVISAGPTESAEPVPVEIGLSDGLQTEILSGLDVGDRLLLPDPTARGGRRP
jgi:multidrug efflux pump subunit AcrA (membrane-fusion protein)